MGASNSPHLALKAFPPGDSDAEPLPKSTSAVLASHPGCISLFLEWSVCFPGLEERPSAHRTAARAPEPSL